MLINKTISRRLTSDVIRDDLDTYNGFKTIENYQTFRSQATPEALQQAHDNLIANQQAIKELDIRRQAAADALRLAEWEFHTAVTAMKESVVGQFGSDSDEVQAIGLVKKSKHKNPQRSNKEEEEKEKETSSVNS